MAAAYTQDELESRLDELLDGVLSVRRTSAPAAHSLLPFSRIQQDFVLTWVRIIVRTSMEMGYHFAVHAHEALAALDGERSLEVWIIQAIDTFDQKGLISGIAALRDARRFAQDRTARVSGLPLDAISGVLQGFLQGLSGRSLKLAAASESYTDTETIYLPALVSQFPERADNFRLYKVMAVHLWAQTRYGTWRVDVAAECARYPDPARALALFHQLETLRLDSYLAEDLPGLYRECLALRQQLDGGLPPECLRAQLAGREVGQTLRLLAEQYPVATPLACCYQGTLYPERVAQVMQLRLAREQGQLRLLLARLTEQQQRGAPQPEPAPTSASEFTARAEPGIQGMRFSLDLDGQPIPVPEEVRALLESIWQDLGALPPDYLVAAGPGEYSAQAGKALDPADVWKGTYHEEGAFFYNEWDCDRKHYRKDWCVLRELDCRAQEDDFVPQTLRKHRGLVMSLRRTFEALRGEDCWLKRQSEGEEIDLDAAIAAYADSRAGLEQTDRVFSKLRREERHIAVLFMVDMSGSTKGWINDAERESLVLLCEALETLGDRYAIYGFSGMTRKRCEIYRVKRFDERYDTLVKARISGITPQDYTRMGVAVRHLTQKLLAVEARIKLLVTLSDGKPDDYHDNYRGTYGIEDTRQALLEARRQGVHPFCITIDETARDYLPHLYGNTHYVLIDEVRKLPLKVADIYRKLTS